MKKFSKTFWVAIACFIMGVACAVAESVFYDTLDENGVLQESLFLPLSFLFVFIGMMTMGFVGGRQLFRKLNSRRVHRDARPPTGL